MAKYLITLIERIVSVIAWFRQQSPQAAVSWVIRMPFPEKFRALIELREGQVTIPDYVWLSYAVCAVEEDSCGWGGWIIESAWKTIGENREEVKADTEQGCPVCGKQVFRTGVEKQFRFNPDAGPKIDYPYESVPIKFAKSKATSTAKKGRLK